MENERDGTASGIPQQRRYQFTSPSIYFSSCFDSGNMHRAERTGNDHYSLWTASDAQGSQNEGYPKSWFYFEVGGAGEGRITLSIFRLHFLSALTRKSQFYRPVYRERRQEEGYGEWMRLPYPILSLGPVEGQIVLKFDYLFTADTLSVQFAFTYPYSYEHCREDVTGFGSQFANDPEIFLQHYELTKSYEGRIIDCLQISSHEGRDGWEAIKVAPFEGKRVAKFRSNKPIIFVSARVHPIQTPSSFCMLGIIRFLLDKKDARAHLLRKYFVFVLVPMLNPDGVARGHCRMDELNQNLNRFYSQPDAVLQPSCFAVKRLCEHYTQERRLFMYLDLHAHPALKGNFIFGNAIYEFVEQVESQIFPRTLARNCPSFEFDQCNFSRKHMKARDRNEEETKEGCARVVLYKDFGIVHSYTLELGYHMNSYNNQIQLCNSTNMKYMVRFRLNERGEKIYEPLEKQLTEEKLARLLQSNEKPKNCDFFQFTPSALDDLGNEYYKRQLPIYTTQTFQNLGRNVLVTILDIWGKNPYTRVEDINDLRREIAERQSKLDRFRKEQAGIKTKQKRIVELIQDQFYGDWVRRNVLNPSIPRDKRRNNTLQAHKPNLKLIAADKTEKYSKIDTNTETIETDLVDPPPPSASGKLSLSKGGEQESRRNVKLSRINFASSLSQNDKYVPRQIRQPIGSQLKISLENELPRTEGLSVSSKQMKMPNFNAMNMRVRNIITGIKLTEQPARSKNNIA